MRRLRHFLFWMHCALVLGFIALAFFLPFRWMLLVVVLHRTHLLCFKGCVLSRVQKWCGGSDHEADFLPEAGRRIFGVSLSPETACRVDYGITLGALLLSYLRDIVV